MYEWNQNCCTYILIEIILHSKLLIYCLLCYKFVVLFKNFYLSEIGLKKYLKVEKILYTKRIIIVFGKCITEDTYVWTYGWEILVLTFTCTFVPSSIYCINIVYVFVIYQ